ERQVPARHTFPRGRGRCEQQERRLAALRLRSRQPGAAVRRIIWAQGQASRYTVSASKWNRDHGTGNDELSTMIPRLRPAILLLVAPCLAALPLPLRAQEGQVGNTEREERPSFLAWSKGRAAERAGNLEDALAAYLQAQRDEPENAQYRERVQSLRFALAQSFTDRAERATLAGNLVEAASYLRRALSYDSESGVARERLRQLQRHAIEETTSIPEYNSAAPQLAPLPGTRDLDYRGDARGAYLEVARLFGLAALFDEDATKVHIRLQLSGVDFRAATDLLGEQTGTFLR